MIGASAGGLEPLRTVVASLRPNGTTATLIVHHVLPEHETLLPQLLAPIAQVDVALAPPNAAPLALTPDRCLIIPATHDAELLPRGQLRLTPSVGRAGPHPSIDRLLLSAAHHFGPRTVAIILSGTGNDGVAGAIAVHRAGGVVWVQAPESAQFADLPQAVITTGAYTAVLPPEAIAVELPQLLTRLVQPATSPNTPPRSPSATDPDPDHPPASDEAHPAPLDHEAQAAFDRILRRVGPYLNVDLADYLPETLLRQTVRAMQRSGFSTLVDFANHLEENEAAVHALARALLIGVTAFYRDPAAFSALKEPLRALLQSLPEDAPLRVWVCGCATGEEAYSLAFLVADLIAEADKPHNFLILGTDLNAAAIHHARAGLYPEEALTRLPPHWRERYFVREGALWRVQQKIRNHCVFSRHDALNELPFLHLHLVSCRNLLIYLKPEPRDRLVKAFHYALVPGGLLLLGRSETLPDEVASHFTAVSSINRVFRRDDAPTPKAWLNAMLPARFFAAQPPEQLQPKLRRVEALETELQHSLNERLLARYAPPAILTDTQGRPLHIVGDCSAFLRWPQGKSDFTLPALVPPSWRTPLKLVMRQLLLPTAVTAHSLPLIDDDTAAATHLTAERIEVANQPFLLFVFEPLLPAGHPPAAHEGEATSPREGTPGEAALQRTIDRLHVEQEQREALIDALERAQAELQALYEELQTTTEELQSANEELEAGNEELHASNEELRTLNEGLDRSLAEQAALNELLEAILNALTGPLLVLDESERLLRYNPAAASLFTLSDTQLGRPFPFDRARFPWPDAERRTALFAAAEEKPQTVELDDGTRYWLCTVNHWRAAGERSGFVVKLLDTTNLKRAEAEKVQLEEQLSTIAAALQEAIFMAPAALDRFAYASPRLGEWLGTPSGAPTWAQFLTAIDPDSRASVEAQWQRLDSAWQQRYRLRCADGSWRIVQERGVRIPARPYAPEQIAATLLDVTEESRLAEQAAINQARLAAVWDNPTVGIALLDDHGAILAANDPFAAWLGQTPETLSGKPFATFTHPESALSDAQQWSALDQGAPQPVEKRIVASDGTTHWVTQHLSRQRHPPPIGTFHVAIWQNIDTTKAHEKLIFRQAHFDALTGLPNRALARDRLEQAIARARRNGEAIFLLFVDLDGFKEVNDLYGHDAGDELLREVAERLRQCVRTTDTVARLGGDEFLILVEGAATATVADRIADAALVALRRPFTVKGERAQVSASIGIASFPADAEEAETLMRLADTAMYAAKEAGKNRIRFFSSSLEESTRHKIELRHQLERALANGELELYFQPVITLPERRCASAEALLRWNHPSRGIVSAGEFIAVAEESGLIRPLGEWVLREAARLALLVAEQHPSVRLAVNLSAAQFGGNELAKWAKEAEAALPHLIVEVTESIMMNPEGSAAAFLHALRDKGALIAVDDFGTGYSNLSQLETLAIDIIKIDKRFTDRVGQKGIGEAIASIILQLAHAIGARVVVEGVETAAQLAFFEPFAPIAIQGYHFAKPMPWGAFLSFLAESRP